MMIKFIVKDDIGDEHNNKATRFADSMCSLIQEHTLYESYEDLDRHHTDPVAFFVEVADNDICNNPDLLGNLASLAQQIVSLSQLSHLNVSFTSIRRQQ